MLPSQSLHNSLYVLNLEFPLTITKIVPFSIMFDHCESEIVQIRIRIPFFSKRGKPCLQGFYSISNTIITSKTIKLYWRNEQVDVMVRLEKDKSNNLCRIFLKPCTKLIWNFNLFPRVTNSGGKSKVRKVRKFLTVLDARESTRKFPTKY